MPVPALLSTLVFSMSQCKYTASVNIIETALVLVSELPSKVFVLPLANPSSLYADAPKSLVSDWKENEFVLTGLSIVKVNKEATSLKVTV